MTGASERKSGRSVRGIAAPVLLAVVLGVLAGLGVFTFGYARGASYITDDPAACANCHVMRNQFQSWMKSSHGKVAVCNDCHTPPGFIPKYATKAINGFFHSLAFTTNQFPDEIHITQRNFKVTGDSCLKCHEQVVEQVRGSRSHRDDVNCVQCHSAVGHM